MADRSSQPRKTRCTVDELLAGSVEQLRRPRMPMRRIAELVGRSVSTIGRLLARLGLSSLKALEPVRRCTHTFGQNLSFAGSRSRRFNAL